MNRKLLLAAFFLAGFTTFVYEISWARPLQIIFGSTVYAASVILTSFLAGFSLGSYISGTMIDRIDETKSVLRHFVLIELGIGTYGFAMVAILSSLPLLYSPFSAIPGFSYIQFLMCFLILIVPAALMGAAWPVVNRAYVKSGTSDAGTLFSSNALGGSAGPLAAGFLLIPLLGITATSMLAASINIGIAAFLYFQIRGDMNEG